MQITIDLSKESALDDLFINATVASDITGYSMATFTIKANLNNLPKYRIGKQYFYLRSDVDKIDTLPEGAYSLAQVLELTNYSRAYIYMKLKSGELHRFADSGRFSNCFRQDEIDVLKNKVEAKKQKALAKKLNRQ